MKPIILRCSTYGSHAAFGKMLRCLYTITLKDGK